MNTDHSAAAPSTNKPILHLLVLGSFLVPLVCIPYIPIRRHLLNLRRSIHTLSDNTLLLQRELSNTLRFANLRKEENVKLADQLRELRVQLDAVTKSATESENARRRSETEITERLRGASELVAKAEHIRLTAEESLRQQADRIERRADEERIPWDLLRDVSTSLADTATFLEEVEIQLGWSHSMPRDRGIDRMRQLALKLHSMAQVKSHPTHI